VATRRSAVRRSLRSIERAFADIESSLKSLAKRVKHAERSAGRRRGGVAAGPRRSVTLTPKRRAQLKLQGAYMGYMRQLKPAQKARVKSVKERRGFEAAIRLAKSLAS
jgi:hypothetical protein